LQSWVTCVSYVSRWLLSGRTQRHQASDWAMI